jgi:hypothetical protein
MLVRGPVHGMQRPREKQKFSAFLYAKKPMPLVKIFIRSYLENTPLFFIHASSYF